LWVIIDIGLYGAAEPVYKGRLASFRYDDDDDDSVQQRESGAVY